MATPAGVTSGGARVEADARFADDEWIVARALVEREVVDDQQIARGKAMATHRTVDRRFARLEPDTRLEPLPVLLDQADERGGGLADMPGDERDIVEIAFRFGIEDVVVAKGRQPLPEQRVGMIGGNCCGQVFQGHVGDVITLV